MKMTEKGLAMICKFEGDDKEFKPYPYLCPAGVATIGYGTTYYEDGRRVRLGDPPITKQQAFAMIKKIIAKNYEKEVNRLIKKPLNQNQFDALVSFAYNLGSTNLSRSTLLKKININPNDPSIRTEFLKWVFANKKKLRGLEIRRKAEADLYFKKPEE